MTLNLLKPETPGRTDLLTPIGAAGWVNIFKLLGLVVVADNKIRPESVAAFQDGLIELRAVIDPRLVMTRHMILDWFKLNRTELSAAIESLEYDQLLIDLIQNIRSLPHKLDVMTVMVRIAASDGEYSNKEKLLIKKTLLYWNIKADEMAAASKPQLAEKSPSRSLQLCL